MIALDEEEYIARAIKSVNGIADEIIVIDGGSKDGTVRITNEFPKVKCFVRQWDDDYSTQRNFAISKSQYEWIFSLDCDEFIDEYVALGIRQLIDDPALAHDLYQFQYKHITDNQFINLFDLDWHYKLFKRYCHYEKRLHERVVGFSSPSRCNLDIKHIKTIKDQELDNLHYVTMESQYNLIPERKSDECRELD
jgi:glycosyltransferase involved in cell wall biosynthesis